MKTRINQWLIQRQLHSQERRRVRELQRLWRQGNLKQRLVQLPFTILLKAQLQKSQEAENAKTASPPDRHRLWRRIEQRMLPGRNWSASNKPSRIRLLFHRLKTRLQRWLVLWAVCQVLKAFRLFLGTQKV